ncbi:Uncharacterized protein OBRU01_06455, partial [Operophtera brumata]
TPLTYRVSLMYILNSIDRVFKVSVASTPVHPNDKAQVDILFRPTTADQSYTDYYVVDDTAGNNYRICKNETEQRKEMIDIINKSSVETTYQWLLPVGGQGHFHISTGNCGLIRAHETITTTLYFTGTALGVYTTELVCLVLNQEPLYLNAVATVVLPGNPLFNIQDHVFKKNWKQKSRCTHLMENSLNRLNYIPPASVFDRYLDFGTGSINDVTLNISQTLCVTNHTEEEGCIQWIPDPDNVFIIDPIASVIPQNESRLFTSYNNDTILLKHTWFRIPCIGDTWTPCTEWRTGWDCPTEVVLPPTVPARTTFQNFMLANKLEIPMYFKFEAPNGSNFVVLPMCGIVQGRGWQIISVALEARTFGEYCETWDLVINKVQKTRIYLSGNAEISQVQVMSPGYNPATHAMFEFPPTITGCTNYVTAYLHNLTRMEIHLRVLNSVSWFGADDCGSIVLPPKEIVKYHWWFFPKTANKVYETTITCSGVLPNTKNLHDVVVGESLNFAVTLYNYGSCYFTSKLYHIIDGMDDDFSGDRFEIDSTVIMRTISVKCPVILSNHCVWNIVNVDEFNKALIDCRPNKPLNVNIYAPDLCLRNGFVEMVFVMGCVFQVNVPWSLRREKICDCEMIEVQIGISMYEMRHTCKHRPLIELSPLIGIVSPDNPGLLYLKFKYAEEGHNVLCYILTMPNQRLIYLYINIVANLNTKGILTPLRRPVGIKDYLAVMDCGRVPINNLDPVIRIVWLYNPTDVFTTWRLVRGNTISPDSVIRCLLYFAEVPPLGKLAIPFAFMPTEMIDYEMTFFSSFGYDTVKILVSGQGGLPNCVETRMDIPSYVAKIIRSTYRREIIYLSMEHVTVSTMPTHSLSRDVISICNDTDHILRERIANIVNIVMTPCWGVIQPKSTEWITMTVYTLQEPATFTTTVACEILDLTERKRYQRNELLRRNKIDKCNQEFIITEEGLFHPGINDSPPYVEDIEKPQPSYLAMTVSISSKGQRDGYQRMLLKQMWEQVPPYDLLSSEMNDPGDARNMVSSGNNMTMADIIRVIDGIIWDALHSKMFRNQIEYFAKEEIPTYAQLVKVIENDVKPRLSRRYLTNSVSCLSENCTNVEIVRKRPKAKLNGSF